jgi:hypothetical protein
MLNDQQRNEIYRQREIELRRRMPTPECNLAGPDSRDDVGVFRMTHNRRPPPYQPPPTASTLAVMPPTTNSIMAKVNQAKAVFSVMQFRLCWGRLVIEFNRARGGK